MFEKNKQYIALLSTKEPSSSICQLGKKIEKRKLVSETKNELDPPYKISSTLKTNIKNIHDIKNNYLLRHQSIKI
ncbi:hypothetical protein Avbf_05625 [Armadillidium vulgare]|nr:hypothetical protein Avbf_05625 [Armadillidium vulgare]